MSSYDDIIIGSGLNSLVCAALLARKGRKVCVLERNNKLGGCIVTEEATLPGFKHDLLSSWHPLFITSGAYAELGGELEKHGLVYAFTEKPAAGLRENGESFVLHKSRDANIAALGSDGEGYKMAVTLIENNAELIFALLSQQLRRFSFIRLVIKAAWRMGIGNVLAFIKGSLGTAREWLQNSAANRAYHACMAPWVLHVGLGPESPTSSLMAKVVMFTLEAVGMPVVVGGSYNLVAAFKGLIEEHGGELHTNAEAAGIEVSNGRATGVALSDGRTLKASGNIICNVTPQQLYGKLIPASSTPAQLQQQAESYRYGRADMQIHIAMDAPAQWSDPQLNDVAMIHLSDGIDALSQAVNEAERGLLPQQATIVVGQPCAVDSSRAPEGKWILWLQLQELPPVVKGDAANSLPIPENGEWTEALREAYADRIVERLSNHITNLKQDMLKRVVLSPADLQAANINLVGGDPYSGDCAIDQNLFMRPTSAAKNHSTSIKNVFHIGASTHPGPGLNGGSGFLVGKEITGGR